MGILSFSILSPPVDLIQARPMWPIQWKGGLKFEVLQESISDHFQCAFLSPAADGVQSLYGVWDGGLKDLPSSGHSD